MDEIFKLLPQRPPFLFVDRVIHQEREWLIAEKDVKAEEPYFAGHFPGRPIMPGVLICEFVFQAGALLIAKLDGAFSNRLPVLTRIQNVRIKNTVVPGDTISAEVILKERIGNAFYLKGKVTAGSKKVMTLELNLEENYLIVCINIL